MTARRTPTPRAGAARGRRGFTIVEVVVAIMLLSVGFLALAAGSVGVLRMMTLGRQKTLAAAVAQMRIETLRNTPCASLASAGGTATTRGLTETWSITAYASNAYAIAETVSYKSNRGTLKKIGVQGLKACPR